MLARLQEIEKGPANQPPLGLTSGFSKVWIHPSPSKCHPQDVSLQCPQDLSTCKREHVYLGVHRCSWTSSSRRALTLPEWSQICGAVVQWAENGWTVWKFLGFGWIWETSGTHSHAITCIFCEAWSCAEKAPDWQAYWAQVPRFVINLESPSGWNQWPADASISIIISESIYLLLSVRNPILDPPEHCTYSLQDWSWQAQSTLSQLQTVLGSAA